jgi:hypothetical protein
MVRRDNSQIPRQVSYDSRDFRLSLRVAQVSVRDAVLLLSNLGLVTTTFFEAYL